MGWGWLGKLGKIAAGVAAPFTGGLSLAAIPAISAAQGAANGGGWRGALRGAAGGGVEALTAGIGGPLLSKIPGVNKIGGGVISRLMGGGGGATSAGQSFGQALKSGAGVGSAVKGAATNAAKGIGTNVVKGGIMSQLMNGGQGAGGGDNGPLGMTEDDLVNGGPASGGSTGSGGANSWNSDVTGMTENPDEVSDPSTTGASTTGGFGSIVPGTGRSGLQNIIESLKNPDNLADIASAVGKFGETEANNRTQTGNFTQAHDQLRLMAEQDRRASESDAWKKLGQTSYVLGGGRPYTGSAASPYTFGFGPKAPNATMQQAAGTLQGQLMARIQPGAGWQPAPLENYTKQGKAEKTASYASLIASILGGVMRGQANKKQAWPEWGGTPPYVAPNNGVTIPPNVTGRA